jgi:hypothetical protein
METQKRQKKGLFAQAYTGLGAEASQPLSQKKSTFFYSTNRNYPKLPQKKRTFFYLALEKSHKPIYNNIDKKGKINMEEQKKWRQETKIYGY